MLSIFTNKSAMASMNALNRANNSMGVAMERLGTGKRINRAADDAAGLQIATRLQGQFNGMATATQNIAQSKGLLSTAEGAFEEVNNILFRMKDLATQAADDTNGQEERKSMQSEFSELNKELNNIMSNTSYGSEKLLRSISGTAVSGKLSKELQFQIGASKEEVLKVNMSTQLNDVADKLNALTAAGISGSAQAANGMLDKVNASLDSVGTMRAALGATVNRLDHTNNNLANMKDNTDANIGTIRDADVAAENLKMMRQSMLFQGSQAMLLQSNQQAQGLLQFMK